VAGGVNADVNGFNTIEDGGGFKRGIKGGKMKARSGGWRWGTELTAGAHLTERRGKGGQLGRREPKGKTYSREDATNARARWASRAVSACGGSEAGGLAGPKAEWAARSAGPKVRKKNF
jgi:hypothetical protein